jgi:CTP synthase
MAKEHYDKLSLFCNVRRELVFEEVDVANTIYEVPLELAKQDVDKYILELLGFHVSDIRLDDWQAMVRQIIEPKKKTVAIDVVGKYITLRDAYKSIYEALEHGANANRVRLEIRPVDSEDIEAKNAAAFLDGVDGVLVPGGFGDRGIEGKIQAVRYARENRIPFLGICLGMQCAVIEFARNVCGLAGANSSEFRKRTPHPVIHLMKSQKKIHKKGGTMRLGAYPCVLDPESRTAAAYGTDRIDERHRHRYEFNNKYRERFTAAGMRIAGTSPDNELVEVIEIVDHPWFVASQFHPEFKSRPLSAHPLFKDFVAAAGGLSAPNVTA